jgi:hypothetical protein
LNGIKSISSFFASFDIQSPSDFNLFAGNLTGTGVDVVFGRPGFFFAGGSGFFSRQQTPHHHPPKQKQHHPPTVHPPKQQQQLASSSSSVSLLAWQVLSRQQ